MAQHCALCNRYHLPTITCNPVQRGAVYAVQQNAPQSEQVSYLIPTQINNKSTLCLRDTGNESTLLVSEDLVRPEQLIPGRFA